MTLKTTAGDITFGTVKDGSPATEYLTVTKDVEITGVVVTAVPAVKVVKTSCSVVNAYTVEIGFNQAVKDTTIVKGNFSGTYDGTNPNTVASVSIVNATTVRVTYVTALADSATVKVANVESVGDSANTIVNTTDEVTIGLTSGTYSITSVG